MKKRLFWKAFVIYLLSLGLVPSSAANQFLTNVQVSPDHLDFTNNTQIQISWHQAVVGIVKVMICDLDGNIVRILVDSEEKASGTHTTFWDGKEVNGLTCPVGVYLPIIKIKTDRGQIDTYNSTRVAWGTELSLESLVYDANRQVITFNLPQPALCRMRIGKAQGGPCYGTLLNWVPRPAGINTVPWTVKDARSVFDVGENANMTFSLVAFALPQNALLLTGSSQGSYPENAKYRRFPIHPAHGERICMHANHRRKACRDFAVTVKLQDSKRKWRGQSALNGKVGITITMVKDELYKTMKREKFEIYLYVDNQFIIEEKRNDIPANIVLDTTKLSNGYHYVTVGLSTLDDHIGSDTIKIRVDN